MMLTLISTSAKADEGMWMICNISHRTDSVLRTLGLELSPEEIYSADQPSLNNAIVMFGGYCSGVVVSSEGLVFTNHHCGYGSIQSHSSTSHDYLKNGFFAKKQKDELPNKDLYVSFHLSTIDVTDKVLSYVPFDADERTRALIIDSVCSLMSEAVEDTAKFIHGEVVPYYRGDKYYLSIYQDFKDVRLVCAPPECLGKFGGDTDNWVWPRQTCDFSVFRIYADKYNNPAEYSENNVPYKPVRYAHVSLAGYRPGSYCMTFGYPGSTSRYLCSYGIVDMMENENKPRIQVREVILDSWKNAMEADDAVRIKYSSKYAQCSNYWKNSIGMNESIERFGVLDEKRNMEKELNEWIMSDTDANSEYVGVLDSLNSNYASNSTYKYVCTLIEETLKGSSLNMLSLDLLNHAISESESEGDYIERKVTEAYKDIDMDLEKKTLSALLKNYASAVPDSTFLLSVYSRIDSAYNGDIDAYIADVFSTSKLANQEEAKRVKNIKEVAEDPVVDLTFEMLMKYYMYSSLSKDTNNDERRLEEALRAMNKDKEYYPDANFTLRMSYGIVEGYSPMKNIVYDYYTKASTLLDKNNNYPTNRDYDLIPTVKEWFEKSNFGKKYYDKTTGDMHLCFLTNNDITGGNSGSGMFDGKGRLIGLAFDGDWEAMSSDVMFNEKLTRCIGVDIRYVLSVIERYSKGKRIIKELTIEK